MFSLSFWFFSSLDRSHSQFPGKTASLFPQGITLCNFALFLIEDWISRAKQVGKANVNVDWVVALLKISIQMGEVVIAVIYSMRVAESNKMLPGGLWSLLWNSGNEYVPQCCWRLARVGLHFWETGCGCTANISILLSTHINTLLKV